MIIFRSCSRFYLRRLLAPSFSSFFFMLSRSLCKPRFVIIALFLLVSLHLILRNFFIFRNHLSYATRPIWDTPFSFSETITHYYGEDMPIDAHVCRLHGWDPRPSQTETVVFDAMLMSNELDLLEIRLNELDAVVDYFVILESNATFTGLPKKTYFADNRERFSKFEKKILYQFFPGYPLSPGKTPWNTEADTRDAMTKALRSYIGVLTPNAANVVIMSDIDEIPSRHTLSLLRTCDFKDSLHLQMRTYLYSFEWFLGLSSWRASVQTWNSESFYRHSKSTERILADAGWHCSYCFRHISDYIVKMQGYSHADRLAGRTELLEPDYIQDTICKGKDIFGMLPEAYTFSDLLSQMNPAPSTSAVGLPSFLIRNAEKFSFLLPGGCQRTPQ